MKFEDLIEKPLHEMTDDEVDELIKKLSAEQLRSLEAKIKKRIKKKRKVPTKKKKKREEEFKKLLAGGKA